MNNTDKIGNVADKQSHSVGGSAGARAFQVRVTVHNGDRPHTIWGKLAAKLGREPTNAEASAEVRRILSA